MEALRRRNGRGFRKLRGQKAEGERGEDGGGTHSSLRNDAEVFSGRISVVNSPFKKGTRISHLEIESAQGVGPTPLTYNHQECKERRGERLGNLCVLWG